MNVRELIAQLIKYDMDSEVFIGLGPNNIPSEGATTLRLADYEYALPQGSDGNCHFGVYIIPEGHLEFGG